MTNELLHWKHRVFGPIYCKGGGGGDNTDWEAIRRQQAIQYLNNTFGSRESRRPAYEQHAANVRAFNEKAINEDFDVAERERRDALARARLTGGSADIDQSELLRRKKAEGFIESGRRADAAASELEMGDEQTKQSLINQINAGLDAGSAGNALYSQMQATRESASARDLSTRINNFFKGIGAIYENQQLPGMVAAGRQGQPSAGIADPLYARGGYTGRGAT